MTHNKKNNLTVSNEDLVISYRKGNQDSAGELYQRWVRDLTRLINKRIRDWHYSEDLAHDVFIDALEGFDPERAQFSGYILGITKNKVRAYWAKIMSRRTSVTSAFGSNLSRIPSPVEYVIRKESDEFEGLSEIQMKVLGIILSGKGLFGLTERQKFYLDQLKGGQSKSQISKNLGLSRHAFSACLKKVSVIRGTKTSSQEKRVIEALQENCSVSEIAEKLRVPYAAIKRVFAQLRSRALEIQQNLYRIASY